MAALNAGCPSLWTGIRIPLLPRFPMETWNFRIVHVAGALFLGFILFASTRFDDDKETADTRALDWIGMALMIPALFSLGVAIWFALQISGGVQWTGIDGHPLPAGNGCMARR